MKTLLKTLLPVLLVCSLGSCRKDKSWIPPKAAADGSDNTNTTFYANGSWTWYDTYYALHIPVPELTNDILYNGTVLVYYSLQDDNWIPLPFMEAHSSVGNYHMNYYTDIGSVEINWWYDASPADTYNPEIFYGSPVQFKVVVIP